MRLRNFIRSELIFTQLRPRDKTELFDVLVDRLARLYPTIDAVDLLEKLKEREAEDTTGIGDRVAIPHARVAGLEQTVCALARLPDGLDFGAADGEKVSCVFLLVSPIQAVGDHIRVLARIARLVHDRAFIAAIMESEDAEAIFRRLTEEDARHVE